MKRSPMALACLLLACSPAASLSTAAVNGTVDSEGRWSGVLGMQIRKPEGIATCTGVLIAPNLLLTARHCVSSTRGTDLWILPTCSARGRRRHREHR